MTHFEEGKDKIGHFPLEPKRVFVEKKFMSGQLANAYYAAFCKAVKWDGHSLRVEQNRVSVFDRQLDMVAPKRGRPKK